MSAINVRTIRPDAPGSASSDLLMVCMFKEGLQFGLPQALSAQLPRRLSGRFSGQLAFGDFSGKAGETSLQFGSAGTNPNKVILVGLGDRASFTKAVLRDALVTAFKDVKKLRVSGITVTEPYLAATGVSLGEWAKEVGLVAGMVDYVINHFKTDRGGHKPETRLGKLDVISSAETAKEILAGLEAGLTMAKAVNFSRDLVNLPAGKLTPTTLAQHAMKVAAASGGALEVKTYRRAQLKTMKAHAFLAVGKGSAEEPVLIELSYNPTTAVSPVYLGLIGKSVTFDSGGLDLKPADGMRWMKCDMAGGASVLAAMSAIAALQIPVRIKAVLAATENMPGPHAYKPGDVIETMAGLTVEVDNTDAEGRLTLADAIEFAKLQGVTHLVDLATLTGAIRAALGSIMAGAFGNNADFTKQVLAAAETAGELVHEMPMHAAYARANESRIADLKNSGGAAFGAGSITAAWFLRKFAGDTPWVHLDIAAVAFRDSEYGADPAGGTGWGVLTILALAEALAAKPAKV